MRPSPLAWVLAVTAAAVPAAAGAQTITLTNAGQPNIKCSDSVSLSYSTTASTAGNPCTALQFWAQAGEQGCGAVPNAADGGTGVFFSTSVGTTAASGTVPAQTISSLAGVDCSGNASSYTAKETFCAGMEVPGATTVGTAGCGSPTEVSSTAVTLTVFQRPPPAPTLAVTPLDGVLSVDLSLNGDVDPTLLLNSTVQYQEVDGPDAGVPTDNWQETTGSQAGLTKVKVSGLQNGHYYALRAKVTDVVNQNSDYSSAIIASPEEVTGFYRRLVGDGGNGPIVGCSAGARQGGWVLLGALTLIGAVGLRTRRRA